MISQILKSVLSFLNRHMIHAVFGIHVPHGCHMKTNANISVPGYIFGGGTIVGLFSTPIWSALCDHMQQKQLVLMLIVAGGAFSSLLYLLPLAISAHSLGFSGIYSQKSEHLLAHQLLWCQTALMVRVFVSVCVDVIVEVRVLLLHVAGNRHTRFHRSAFA